MKIVTALMVSFLWGHLAFAESGNTNTTGYMESAQISIDNQDWDQAETYLLNVIKQQFNHVNARYLLGKAAEKRGELHLAIKRYKMVLFLDKKHLLAVKGWARVLEKLKSSDVLTAYKRLVILEPNNALWHVKLAQFYMKNRSINAERHLKSALAISSNHRQALQLMVEYHEKFAFAAHAKPFQKRLGMLASSGRDNKPLLISEHQSVKKTVQRISIQKAVIPHKDTAIQQEQKLVDQYMKYARKSMQDKEWMKAETLLSKVIKQNFNHVTARYLLAMAAEKRGDLRLATKRYQTVLFVDKKHLLALTGWGRVSEKLNSRDALVAYQRAIRLEPDNVLWHLKVAQYYMKHQPLNAKRYLSSALKIDPNNRQALELMITYHQQHTLIAHAETYQRRLHELNNTTVLHSEQERRAVPSHKNHLEPSVHVVQQALNEKTIPLSSPRLTSELWDQKPTILPLNELEPVAAVKADNEVAVQSRNQPAPTVFQQYALAAKEGNAHDQLMLGLMYYEGRGVAKNESKAVALLRQAAKQGLPKAQLSLALMLYETRSNRFKEKAAVKWFKHAANQGLAEAQYALGLIYATNIKFKNEFKAVKWWKAAALQGHTQAQHNLGVMYLNGQGVVRNREEAMRWLQQAPDEHKHADKPLNIDQLYSEDEHHEVKSQSN